MATIIMFHFMIAAESHHVEEKDVKNDLPMMSWYLLRYSITPTTVTITMIFPLLPRYSCESIKMLPGRTTTSTLKMTRATSSSVATLVWPHRALPVKGGEQGWVYGESWMRRDLGQWAQGKENGRRRGKVWTASRAEGLAPRGQAEVLVLLCLFSTGIWKCCVPGRAGSRAETFQRRWISSWKLSRVLI